MMNHNEEATDQLEEVSGRWLRDQLRDVADIGQSPVEPSGKSSGPDASSAQLLDGLASSISAAVVEPIRGLEYRREAQQKKIESALQELSGKVGDAFLELGKLRDQTGGAAVQVEEMRAESRRELDASRAQLKSEIDAVAMEVKGEVNAVRGDLQRDVDQLGAIAADIRSGFNSLAEEIGRLQERVREQHEWIEGLRARETQRATAMSELARASAVLKDALAAAASVSGSAEAETAGRPQE